MLQTIHSDKRSKTRKNEENLQEYVGERKKMKPQSSEIAVHSDERSRARKLSGSRYSKQDYRLVW